MLETVTARLCLGAAAGFFLTALLAGVWKYRQMLSRESGLAHPYVDTAHRAALLYSFACVVLAHLAEWSPWPEWIDGLSAVACLLFFALAVAVYLKLGWTEESENQMRDAGRITKLTMLALIVAEVGGATILSLGAWWALAGF